MYRLIILIPLLLFSRFGILAGENLGLFPQIKDWKKIEQKRVYTATDLWEIINGAADIFLQYDFKDLHIVEYSNNDQIIRVELYRHSSFTNTYGIFAAERAPDYPQIKIGTQGYQSQGVLNFINGLYYVKVMSIGEKASNDESIGFIAHEIDEALGEAGPLPEELLLFPKAGQLYLSDYYSAQNFMGYSFFKSAFSVRYGDRGGLQLFLIHSTAEEIKGMMDQYFALFKEDKVWQKDGYWMVQDLFNGIVFIKQKGSYLFGVLHSEDEKEAVHYLLEVNNNIP